MAFRMQGKPGIVPMRAGPYTKPTPVVGGKPGGTAFAGEPDEGRMIYVSGLPFNAEWQELKDHMKQAGDVEFSQILTNEFGKSKGVGFVRYATQEQAQEAVAMLNGTTMDEGVHTLVVDMWTGKKPTTVKGAGPMGGKGVGAAPMAPMGGKGMGAGMTAVAGGACGGGGGSCMWVPMEMYQMMMGGAGAVAAKGGGKAAGGKMGKGGNGVWDKAAKVKVMNLPPSVQWQELKDHMKQAGTVEYVDCRGGTGEVRFSSAEDAQQAIQMLNGTELMGQIISVESWMM